MQPFAIIRPKRVDQARELVVGKPELRVFRAGGVDLFDRMKEGIEDPELLVELRDALTAGVELTKDQPLVPVDTNPLPPAPRYVSAGALTTLAQLAAAALPGVDALHQAAGQAATPGIRNTATLGGNLLQRPRCWYFRNRELVCLKKGGDTCLAITGDSRYHAILGGGPSFIVHPSSLATALLALDAVASVFVGDEQASPQPVLPLHELFVGPEQDPTREHKLAPGDLLTRVWIPVLDDMRSAYQAVREKRSHDWPLVEAAARLRLDQGGSMRDVRVALGHVAPIPWNASQAAALLEGQTPSAKLFAQAADAALADAAALEGNAYKIPMAKGLLRQVLHRASGLALPE
ncbi:Periplasmic aromatic aldehyde oxidoreductase, FAD binding subunit YagS [Enhygromyxa salina]|uniref:Periplasmic aromatic aldehyde oxidoreductase, FAD binding subunit YagS n=1 Tax=Enhygromyxa salina TaxID=215803 RepID=A0A0C2DFN8_9BACT|nr:FAD binding domain-containing protein [Enhygromyxa salina]KIG18447.1 Periplasmic aromatic aldehyde oxidoreductase, FAD binding subunit YagS [Enhygromyxa salina]